MKLKKTSRSIKNSSFSRFSLQNVTVHPQQQQKQHVVFVIKHYMDVES
jgi:hypothetical protein